MNNQFYQKFEKTFIPLNKMKCSICLTIMLLFMTKRNLSLNTFTGKDMMVELQ